LRLRDILASAQQTVAAHEKTKAEQLTELAARRTQIAELQRHVQAQSADLQQSREENRRNIERVATSDRRMVQLEGEARSAQQEGLAVDPRSAPRCRRRSTRRTASSL